MVYEQEQRDDSTRRRISPKVVVAIILAVLALIFVFQNTSERPIHLAFWSFDAPMWIWLLIVLAVGFIVGSIFPWFRRRPRA